MMNIKDKLNDIIKENKIIPENGLGNDTFLFVSSLIPIVNVDLLVYNDKGQILLTRRNDAHCGTGWHIPGGCLRFKETFEERIRKVASSELGIEDIRFDKAPIKIFQIINNESRPIDNQRERAHFITLVFKCYVDSTFTVNNKTLTEEESGYIRWFDKLPEDLLSIQSCYKEILY